MNRAERRARTDKTLKKRLKTGGGLIFGLDAKKKEQPHRMAKEGPSHTYGGSMKTDKQKANRAARRRVHQAVKAEKEIEPIVPDVRRNYW